MDHAQYSCWDLATPSHLNHLAKDIGTRTSSRLGGGGGRCNMLIHFGRGQPGFFNSRPVDFPSENAWVGARGKGKQGHLQAGFGLGADLHLLHGYAVSTQAAALETCEWKAQWGKTRICDVQFGCKHCAIISQNRGSNVSKLQLF